MHSKVRFPNQVFGASLRPESATLAILVVLLFLLFVVLFMTFTAQPAQGQSSASEHKGVPATAREAAALPAFASRLHPHPAQSTLARPHRPSPLDQVIYENGPVNGSIDAWTINYGYVISDSFPGGTVSGFDIWVWEFPGDVMQRVDWSLTSDPNGGTVFGSGTANVTDTFISSNQYGYNIDKVTVTGLNVSPPSGTSWINLQNASVASGDPVYWDENSGIGCKSPGCPSMADESSLGTIPSEAFDVSGGCNGYCPAPCFSEQTQNGFRVIHDFTGGEDGRYQYGGVTIDKAGNLYGSDCSDDLCDSLDVYKLSRKGQSWMFTRLYTGLSGGTTVGPDQSLYGAGYGGPQGAVFNLKPSPVACFTGLCLWTGTVLYQFSGNDDASEPTGVLTFDQAGNLYGTSRLGGGGNCLQGAGCGTVYELMPSSGGWTEKVLYSWKGNGYTVEPGALLVGIDGNLYGRTTYGGDYSHGSVYQLAPSGNGWVQTVLYSFTYPQELPENYTYAGIGLVQDSAGNLYGNASEGGNGLPHGILFLLSPSNGKWVFTTLTDNNDSGDLFNNLAIDASGNLYGTGGLGVNYGCGGSGPCFAYIFTLVHSSDGWQYSTPVYFGGQLFEAAGNVVLDANGNLYGTTVSCGKYNYGTVWEYSP